MLLSRSPLLRQKFPLHPMAHAPAAIQAFHQVEKAPDFPLRCLSKCGVDSSPPCPMQVFSSSNFLPSLLSHTFSFISILHSISLSISTAFSFLLLVFFLLFRPLVHSVSTFSHTFLHPSTPFASFTETSSSFRLLRSHKSGRSHRLHIFFVLAGVAAAAVAAPSHPYRILSVGVCISQPP